MSASSAAGVGRTDEAARLGGSFFSSLRISRRHCLIRLLKRALLAEELVLAGRSVGRVTPQSHRLWSRVQQRVSPRGRLFTSEDPITSSFPDRFHCLARAVSAGCDALVRFRTGPRLRHPRLPGAYCLGEVSSSIPMQEADSNPEKETAWDAGLQPRLLALLSHCNCQTATSKIAAVRIMVVVRGS